MTFNPLVSVVIPYYKHEEFLEAAVKSVLDQTYPDVEAVVVHDPGPSRPPEQVLSHLTGDRLQMITQPQKTTAAQARNTGVKHARGELILPLDSDDLLKPDYLEKTVPILADTEIGGVYTAVQMFGDCDDVYGPEWTVKGIVTGEAGALICVLYRKSLFEAIGGYAGSWRVGEDSDFFLKACKKGFKFVRHPEPLYLYRRHNEATTALKSSRHVMEQNLNLCRDHKDVMSEYLEEIMEYKEKRYYDLMDEYRHLHSEFHKLLELYNQLEEGVRKQSSQAQTDVLKGLKARVKKILSS